MNQLHHLYYAVLETNKEAFTHGLFTEAHQSLSTALGCAFDLDDARKLLEVEERSQEQLQGVEKYFAQRPSLSPLEPEEVSHYRTLIELAANYRALVENVS